jgi:hypothetical protein
MPFEEAAMSWKLVPTRICDGCGAEIDTTYFISMKPEGRKVLRRDTTLPAKRDFCCEACAEWWRARYPENEPWGPSWDEREWWHEQVLTREHIFVRSAHKNMPIAENHTYFEDPEPIR